MVALPPIGVAFGLFAALFVAILALVELGRRLGVDRQADGVGGIERAVFGLMALLTAFTFSSAAIRFESRRSMIVQEADAIRTAFLRLDVLPAAAQPSLRDGFRRYVDSRLEVYRHLDDEPAAQANLTQVTRIQQEIWDAAVAACRESGGYAASLVLPALNAMFTIATARTVGLQTHQHAVVLAMLVIVMLACSLLAGFSMGATDRSWLHVVCFAAVTTVAFYVILDLEYPRLGFIRIDWMDRFLQEVRQSMG